MGERGQGGRVRADAYQGWRIVEGVGERVGVGRDSARAPSDGSGERVCVYCMYVYACVREQV